MKLKIKYNHDSKEVEKIGQLIIRESLKGSICERPERDRSMSFSLDVFMIFSTSLGQIRFRMNLDKEENTSR
jgi:hypothetical protein